MNWYRKQQTLLRGSKRIYDELVASESAARIGSYGETERGDWLTWPRSLRRGLAEQDDLSIVTAEWRGAVEGAGAEAIWRRNQCQFLGCVSRCY